MFLVGGCAAARANLGPLHCLGLLSEYERHQLPEDGGVEGSGGLLTSHEAHRDEEDHEG